MTEEYLTKFGPAMSRLFNITWTERGFLLVFAFIGPALYSLTALGLFYRVRFAGFLAWFIFIGPGIAEFTHFMFPLLRPALSPDLTQAISHAFPNGRYIADMPNYYVHATGAVLLRGNVHGRAANDPRYLCNLPAHEGGPARSRITARRHATSTERETAARVTAARVGPNVRRNAKMEDEHEL